MIQKIRLRNLRSYRDTKEVALAKLNIFVGPNNAGKSAFLSAVELFLRSWRRAGGLSPLAFDELSSFASFDSVLRKGWSRDEPRALSLVLDYEWSMEDTSAHFEFHCKGRASDNVTYVHKATYSLDNGQKLEAKVDDADAVQPRYVLTMDGTDVPPERFLFHGPFPYVFSKADSPRLLRNRFVHLEVVHPYRPVPRSFYVLDDPGLSREDRSLLTFLIDIWRSDTKYSQEIRERIISNLKTLRLITHLDVHPVGRRLGPKVVEIQVAPTKKRESVTIADVGFGLSQVLPLVAYDARLAEGYLLAYQPELHLHPFAQSRLADIFVESIRRDNQVFVETHSPDLILRLQAKVAGGELEAQDVRIFCLNNVSGVTEIAPVDLDRKGSPSIPWPAGFLDTSLGLARELLARRTES